MDTFEFKSEARQLLDLMIHSLYSHKEIFLRELISNASDALDRLHIEALKTKGLVDDDHPYEIRVQADTEARTLTVSDSGVGMSRDEIIEHLGTIARSGTREFLQQAKQTEGETAAELIGQFGVGFYSSFMVAEEVTVMTRRANEEGATRWSSTGDGKFAVDDAEREGCGTTVTLKLRAADEENALADFTLHDVLRGTIRKYSDFVTYPIRLHTPRPEDGGDADTEHDEWPTVNSRRPIWARPESEVTAEEYAEFYRHLGHDWRPPLKRVRLQAEGTFEYTALLFLPEERSTDLYYRDAAYGLQLYVRRIMIMERCEELLPFYLRFVRGVVESPDLNLNVSREILQQDRRVTRIRNGVVRKVLDTLGELLEKEREEYLRFWRAFGPVLKEGLLHDPENDERIRSLLLFQSTTSEGGHLTLHEYVERMKEGQEEIYFLTAEDLATAKHSPHLEAFRAKGYEVLFWTDPVDEFLATHLGEFEGRKFRSVGRGEIELGSEEERAQEKDEREEIARKHEALLKKIGSLLDDEVSEVRLSSRLTTSPACLVGGESDLTPYLRKMLQDAGQTVPDSKRVLELNPDHAVLSRLQALHDASPGSDEIEDYSRLLYGLALMAEGAPVPDPSAFAERVTRLMVRE